MINALLTQAVREGASDIHFEPFERALGRALPRRRRAARRRASRTAALHAALSRASRSWRSSTSPRSACRRTAASRCASAAAPVDVRVSTLPTGARRARRAAPARQGGGPASTSTALGMDGDDARARSTRLIHQPHGIVLVTGPDRLGQDHDALRRARRASTRAARNIMTVEDPIEYELDGIGQTQVNAQIDLTFAQRAARDPAPGPGRHHDRRDPRPRDRADRRAGVAHRPPGALHAAHQRRARAPSRACIDMGVEPFLLASTPARRAGAAPGAQALPRVQAAARARARPTSPSSASATAAEQLYAPAAATRATTPATAAAPASTSSS